jgi:hypothetical protein
LDENTNAIQKNKETLSDASKEAGLEIKAEYMVLTPHHQNA